MNRIFITGGASGLGLAIAKRYAAAGWQVCIGDINETRGAEAARAIPARFFRCDVTSEADLQSIADALGEVDVVVNNAGVAGGGAIEDVSIADWQWMVDINLLGVVRGCRVFVPLMKRQGRGHIVNVASMAGLLDVPLTTIYNATKAAVVSLSETLQHELRGAGIGVTLVCPSFFQTNLHESMRTSDEGLRATVQRLLQKSDINADDIANDIFDAVAARRFYVLPHKLARRAWRLKRFLPRELYVKFVRRQYARILRSVSNARR